ncbi:M4 family metallopeptidase [Dyadobacter sediminis]|uniref:T9SS type A sorting domain-containing protein n=1 Tax=Dyadobacter sediminis TaxID=1493691 RepID=A0A5R9KIT2_9BACT|nr:M4 family metallopeptidase [Dyadobacter sediminis]TLU96130.1 T9SS type A sorting domain-containing protein [Dyadobacter sediminis]GGB79518.1 hypothetical protein GCM10011325_03830 [Dyadobacter sediminis]
MKFNVLLFSLLFCAVQSFAQSAVQNQVQAFAARTGATATIDKATGSLNYLRFPVGKAYKLAGGKPEQKAMAFIQQNSGMMAVKQNMDTYVVKETRKDNYGMEHVVLQQFYKGVPVYDGKLKFHFNVNNDLASLNGNFVPVVKLNPKPDITMKMAETTAIKLVTAQKQGNFKAPLRAVNSTLYVFQKGLAQGYVGPKHLVYQVEVRNDNDVREFMFIDAHTGALVEQFAGMHNIHRTLYETSPSPANLVWDEGDGPLDKLDKWQHSEIIASGHIYNLMKNAFNYVSYDNKDGAMVIINNNPDIFCPNSSWNGITTNYCSGTASDDVVAHEWAHAYTEYTSGLIYSWQPGAINESYSDIWGETVDLLNNYMDEGESDSLRINCGSSQRWQIGEKATSLTGQIRDMWDPTCRSDPGKVTDPQYWCESTDYGGVHINSGVLNHAYALLADGGSYNGQVITGLGLTKAAHIFWHAQENYMTSTTDFAAQADILEASLVDLIGINLPRLSTSSNGKGLSGKIITAADAAQLAKVIAAVELRFENNCNFQTILKPVDNICKGGLEENAFYYEDFESGTDGWVASDSGSNGTWTPREWEVVAAPGGRTGKVIFGIDYNEGDCNFNLQNGVISFASPEITIPKGSTGPFSMAFDQLIAIEHNYDGGNVKYKINGGGWMLVPASAFIANGYNATLSVSENPLQGQPGFTGTDEGSVTGSWGQSRIDLTALGIVEGDVIQFRWDMGTDGCGGLDGWYIDNVRVYSCAEPSLQFVTTSSVINESDASEVGVSPNECLKYIEKKITIKLNKASAAPVTVKLNTPGGTATRGKTADYSITPDSLVLDANNLSRDIVIRVYNDAYIERDETVILSYTFETTDKAVYAAPVNQEHTITIIDDDIVPGDVSVELLNENFNQATLPKGWTVVGGGTYPATWAVVDDPSVELDPAGSPFLYINSDVAGDVALDKIVETPAINTANMSSIQLSFIEYFEVYDDGFEEQALVDVWDGKAWRNILTQTEATGTSGSFNEPAVRILSIPVAYANPNMKVRFRYIANYDYWWAIDNVKISGVIPTQVQTAVTTSPDEQYLGPNATVYFYDPVSKNLMARIKNLSSHDYGCTSVSIDRAGRDETDWVNGYHITNKTFKVTPTYNNPAGEFEITLYYKASELPNFNGPDIKSMGKSPGNTAANQALSSTAVAVENTGFGLDYAFTSTFNSGFSNFGLSDAPPSGPLPVTLSRFEGRRTVEGNLLTWTTTSEVNNDYFVVERSLDGRSFVNAGTVIGNGSTAVEKQYKFLDTGFSKGISYYRLKQVDVDGTHHFSRIIALDAANLLSLKFYPNPVQSMLNIEIPASGNKLLNVKVINTAGHEVYRKDNASSKNGNLSLQLEGLPTGIYQVIVSGESIRYHLSILKI